MVIIILTGNHDPDYQLKSQPIEDKCQGGNIVNKLLPSFSYKQSIYPFFGIVLGSSTP